MWKRATTVIHKAELCVRPAEAVISHATWGSWSPLPSPPLPSHPSRDPTNHTPSVVSSPGGPSNAFWCILPFNRILKSIVYTVGIVHTSTKRNCEIQYDFHYTARSTVLLILLNC